MNMKTAITLLAGQCTFLCAAETAPWDDTFYQYRLPITFVAERSGWQQVPINERLIVDAINALEEFKYSADFFAYNALRCVAVDESGAVADVEAGFFLIETGPDRTAGWAAPEAATGQAEPMFEENGIMPPVRKGDDLTVAVEPDAFHLLRYTTSGGSSPALRYEPIFAEGTKLHKHTCRISYEPRLLQLAETTHETLMQPASNEVSFVIGGRFVNTPKNLSLRRAEIRFLANIRSPGAHHWHIYYQPMGTHYLMTPDLRHPEIPPLSSASPEVGVAEKYMGGTRLALASSSRAYLWLAANTVKLTPRTPVPVATADAIRIACASNERHSFQLVVAPQRAVRLARVEVSDLAKGVDKIPADRIECQHIDYVPIRRRSRITPADFVGWVGDPLVPIEPVLLTPEAGNYGIWLTLDVPEGTPAGVYRGTVSIVGDVAPLFEIPVELTIHPFTLPEFSPLQCNMGGQFFVKPTRRAATPNAPLQRLIDHHGVQRPNDLRKLTDLHFEIMVRNKFTPKNIGLYTPIGLEWDPPPQGFNVDAPDNFFRLRDWDFTEFNKMMAHYVDDLKLNSICIYHSNPIALNIFMHLPGKQLNDYSDMIPFATYGWQSFREATFVGYDIDERHSYRKLARDITRAQYDRLVLDFFRTIAANLDAHGWLGFAHIMIDETHNDKFLKHFLRLLKSDPLTAQIQIGVCVQGLSYFTDPDYNGLLDFYIPQLDESYNRWEPFYFTDYKIRHTRRKIWNYIVDSARFAIDTPGVNNRMIGIDLWQRGVGGYLCWETFLYRHNYGDSESNLGRSGNPWTDPYTRLGNGALSFFYPPRQDGSFPETPDFTVTPSLRMELHREGVNDYEYAWLLEQAMERAAKAGNRDLSSAKAVMDDIRRFFYNSIHWSQNDAWLIDLRTRMAAAIVGLEEE